MEFGSSLEVVRAKYPEIQRNSSWGKNPSTDAGHAEESWRFMQIGAPYFHGPLIDFNFRDNRLEWKTVTVSIDYHVHVDNNSYSVPYQLMKEKVEARVTTTTVEMLFKSRRVASHRRLSGHGRYATHPEHMPHAHRAHAEWSPSRLIDWAKRSGPAVGAVVSEILHSRPHPEQGYRACLGIMRLGNKYGPERLEAACQRARRLSAASYRTVKNILAAGVDRLPLIEEATQPTPRHENIRGAAYYDKETPC